MRIEAPRNIIKLGAQFAFPLLNHKLNSDKVGKHQEWTRKKHNLLTGLAFIVDLGFDCATVALAILENYREADVLKIAHVLGADAIPETLTNLKNKVVNNFANRKRS